MALEWKSEYSVGVKEIDDQHKKLVATISGLFQVIDERKGQETLEKTFDKLVNYGIEHFETEEKYFDEFHYEFAGEHKKAHQAFKDKISDFYKKYKGNDVEISFELADFLEDWLLDHLATEDQKYVKCFKEHGLK